MPFSSSCVAALNALQNSMMLTPRWPSAGPIGGEGVGRAGGHLQLDIAFNLLGHERPPFFLLADACFSGRPQSERSDSNPKIASRVDFPGRIAAKAAALGETLPKEKRQKPCRCRCHDLILPAIRGRMPMRTAAALALAALLLAGGLQDQTRTQRRSRGLSHCGGTAPAPVASASSAAPAPAAFNPAAVAESAAGLARFPAVQRSGRAGKQSRMTANANPHFRPRSFHRRRDADPGGRQSVSRRI